MADLVRLFRPRDSRSSTTRGSSLAPDPGRPAGAGSHRLRAGAGGSQAEALALFDRAGASRPTTAEAHFNRGFLLQEIDDHDAALEAFERAIALNPNHDRALYGLALSLIALRRLDEAMRRSSAEHEAAADEPLRRGTSWAASSSTAASPTKRRDHRPPGQVRAEDRAQLARETGLRRRLSMAATACAGRLRCRRHRSADDRHRWPAGVTKAGYTRAQFGAPRQGRRRHRCAPPRAFRAVQSGDTSSGLIH